MDHMRIGDNVALVVEDETGSCAGVAGRSG
jgi:hypothetical protein